jgi:hypothetical protein
MTDRSKFEQMLEYLISEEEDKAKEIFHQLVVEKSREIYENILSEDFKQDEEEVEESADEEVEESADEEEVDENFAFEADDEEDEGAEGAEGGEDDGDVGGDATDDFMGDIESDDDEEDSDMGGEGDIEDRVLDLEDALDDLRAEFEQMMGGDDMGGMDDMGGDDMGGMDDMDDMGGDDMGLDADEPVKDSFDVSDNFMREYIEKVTGGHGAEKKSSGDNGDNVRSPVAGKNDMGGTTANIAKGGEDGGKGVQSGLLKPTAKEENFGNINVPGGNAGKTAFKKKEPGHGAEKKGSGDNGDKSAGSPINGAPKRAK